MAIQFDEIVPSKDSIWVCPYDDYSDFQIELALVDSKKLDVIMSQSMVKVRKRDGRNRYQETEEFSNDKAARVYAKEVFINFKGVINKKGEVVENNLEKRIEMLQKNNTLLSFIIETSRDESNYMAETKRKDETDFLEDSKSSPKGSSTQSTSR